MKLTASFRVVNGYVAGPQPAFEKETRGAVKTVHRTNCVSFQKLHTKSLCGDDERPAPRQSVATSVETRESPQCNYGWVNHSSPEKMRNTSNHKRKHSCTNSNVCESDPLQGMMNECMHILGDCSDYVSIAHEFVVALGENELEDIAIPEDVFVTRCLDFNPRVEERAEQLANSALVNSLLGMVGGDISPAKGPKFEIRIVPKVSYASAGRKSIMHTVHRLDDRSCFVGATGRLNRSIC